MPSAGKSYADMWGPLCLISLWETYIDTSLDLAWLALRIALQAKLYHEERF